MLNFIIKRLLTSILVIIGVTIVIFSLVHMAPGDPVQMMAGLDAKEEDIEALRAKMGMDKPLIVQYFNYVKGLLHLDLGKSIITNKNISDEIFFRFRNTAELAVAGMLISSVFGIIIGIIAAVNRDRWLDKTLMSLSITGISMPSFLLALLLMLLLVSQWHLLPASGREGSPFTAEGFKYIILPALTLGISGTASIARLTRSSVVAVLNEEFVMTLKAKGLRRKMILFKHILRNASLPILTMIGLDFGYLLGGAVVTETIFAWPGIGKYAMDAISQNDFPAVQGSVLILSMMFMLINLVVDLLYGVLDPRVSLE
ncbi:MAG: ABC transporter permease [Christensenella sp.]|jgi:peptide/nickel transport system permease protein|nr:ABC transporter permease [Christensenella sp.]